MSSSKQIGTGRVPGNMPTPVGFWRKLLKNLTGCQHQYQINLVYYYEKDADGYWKDDRYFKRTIQIGLDDPASLDLGQRHDLHKLLFPEFIKSIDKKSLRNGSARIENIQYLGYFK